jgi:DNA adenine methylase
LARKIVGLFPAHETYVEPFGGGAAVLRAKPRSRLEVYNDLDGEIVSFFRVLRERPLDLAKAVTATPFARAEHVEAYEASEDALERARRLLVRSHFGHGTKGLHARTGFRAAGIRAGTLPVHLWADLPAEILAAAERMRGVVIEQRPALQVMEAHDREGTLHYVDPPYLHETRGRHRYAVEMSAKDHERLLEGLLHLRGHVVVSGYGSVLYDDALRDWRRIELRTHADRALPRIEVIWANFENAGPLFAGGAE